MQSGQNKDLCRPEIATKKAIFLLKWFKIGVGYKWYLETAWTPFLMFPYTISRHIIAKIMFISVTKMSAGH